MLDAGRRLSEHLAAGSIVGLTGCLGAGKTTLVKGLAEGLNIKEEVTSPSYTIIKEYHNGTLPLYHMDLYRIDNLEELFLTGFEELIYGNGISIIEWSEKAGEVLPEEAVSINIIINSDYSRTVQIGGLEL